MRLRLSQDARPQAMTLLIAATISIVLSFIPFAEFLTYPFRIFVTFIHEGGHALAALLTGNSVASLSVAMNASGETYTTQGGIISQVLISSAGYVGSMAFGALLLILIRKAIAARIVLLSCGILVFAMTMIFGFIKPLFCMVRNTVHPTGGIAYLGRFGFDREVCECASRDFLRQLPRRSMRTQRTLRSEDAFFPFVIIRPDGAD